MQLIVTAYRFIITRRLVFPGLLILINLACAMQSLAARDYKRAVYWLSSAVCLLMVAL